jgi:hypothetical protein
MMRENIKVCLFLFVIEEEVINGSNERQSRSANGHQVNAQRERRREHRHVKKNALLNASVLVHQMQDFYHTNNPKASSKNKTAKINSSSSLRFAG